jgi:hypothetical protein
LTILDDGQKEDVMDKKPPKVEVGEDSVVMGQVTGRVGHRSVVIGATDSKGNTIINQPMAVGYGAQADPTSIAIGAFARAGVSDSAQLVAELTRIYEAMKQAPDVAEHQESVAQVRQAIEAAKKNERASVLTHLKAAGYFALGYATNVSASMVATLIMETLK